MRLSPDRSRFRPLALALGLAACTLVVAPSDAAAQSVAKTEFREAKKRYDDGAYDEALQMFQVAWEHSHSPNARLYIARCFNKLGNVVVAYDEYRGAVRDAEDKIEEDDKYTRTRNVAAAELVLLEPKIGRLVIVRDGLVPDAKISLNGREVPSLKIGQPIPLEPGTHTVTASAEGKEDIAMELNVVGGRLTAAPVRFPTTPGEPVPVVAPPPPPPEEDEPLSVIQIAGIGTMALGGVTLVLAAVSGGAAASKFAAVNTACAETRCTDESFGDVVDSGKLLETLSYVGIGVGAAALLGGGAMFIWGGEDDGADQAARLTPLPGGAALSYQLRF